MVELLYNRGQELYITVSSSGASDFMKTFDHVFYKAGRDDTFTNEEILFIKRLYRHFRTIYRDVMTETGVDEFRTLAIAHSLHAMEKQQLTQADFISEIFYAYLHVKDTRSRGRILRTEIAYRFALATAFYRDFSFVTSSRTTTPAATELLHQLNELENAISAYQKWKSRKLAVHASEPTMCAA